ncbi:aminoglycoside phosphotransferase family protein [Promicromonospora sp. NPDC023987]|uniref:phosphotransferase family protein n=1 Tax=Promicromonospora sp. NPDC023987 TaxID=3155360 RepID=UPI0033DB582B
MSPIHPDHVLRMLGLHAADSADAPTEGMSGSTLTRAVADDGAPAIVKMSVLDSDAARDQAYRELAVYTEIAPEHAIPTPCLIAHHRTTTWIAIALARHDPAPPAPEWSAAEWSAFAKVLGGLHRDVHPVPAIFPREHSMPAEPQGGLKSFAERLWHGPGDPERIRTVLNDLEPLEEVARSGPVSFVHGDCHIGNVLTADRQLMLVDWQSARVGPSAADLAFTFTRAVPTGAAIPRDYAIAAYCDEAGVDVARTDQRITAHQILTLVRQYPEFAGYLDQAEADLLRNEFDDLLSRWRSRGSLTG